MDAENGKYKTGVSGMNSAAHTLWAAKGHPDKKVILVVSFGTRCLDSLEAAIGAVEKSIQEAFPDYEVRRAFSSQFIIDRLKKEQNLCVDNLTQAMERLVTDGVGTLICQPTYIINGFECAEMVKAVEPFASHFKTLAFGKALLSSVRDYKDIAAAIKKEFPVAENSALVLMGHGSEHFANSAYAALAYHFINSGVRNTFVGTVESYPDLNDILKNLQGIGVSRVILTPFMTVAGRHVKNDMTGSEKESWKSRFEAEGYDVDGILKGLGEYGSIRDIFVTHVRDAIKEKSERPFQ